MTIANCFDTPPPSSFSSHVELIGKSVAGNESEVSQQQFNINSTVIQQDQSVDLKENELIIDAVGSIENQQVIQQTIRDEGERVVVEQDRFDDVLQNERPVESSTTQLDTFSQTNCQNFSSQQKDFAGNYQPVEVLNSEGEWISGYLVHKCLVVANLAGVERKYALYDELGDKYVFWGEIRLPRAK